MIMYGIDDQQTAKLVEKAFPALESKLNELNSLGYEEVTIKQIIDCLLQNAWKRNIPNKIHIVVQDILSLKPSIYMSFITTGTYSMEDDLMSSIHAVTNNED